MVGGGNYVQLSKVVHGITTLIGRKNKSYGCIFDGACKVRCLGGNMLANIGPRPDGTLQDEVALI